MIDIDCDSDSAV